MNAPGAETTDSNPRPVRKGRLWQALALIGLLLIGLFWGWREWSYAWQRARIPVLLQQLDDPDVAAHSAAARELERMGVSALPHLAAALSHTEKPIRRHAILQIDRLAGQQESALELLLPALRDPDDGIRRGATGCLLTHTPLSRPLRDRLIAMLEEQDPFARDSAVTILGGNGASSLKAMRDLLRNGRLATRLCACRVIGYFFNNADSAIPELRLALKDRESLIRMTAAETLGRLGKVAEEAIPDLIELTQDGVDVVRIGAVDALGRLSAVQASERLIELLNDPVVQVQESAAQALAGLGLFRMLSHPHLVVALAGVEPEIQDTFREAISRVQDQLTPASVSNRQKIAEGIGKAIEPDLLALRLPKNEQDELRQSLCALASSEEKTRFTAFVALQKSGSTAVPLLRKLIATQNDLIVRGSAIFALGVIGPGASDAIMDLLPFMEDENPTIAWRAARSLGSLGKAAVPGLVRVLETGSDRARMNAANALWMLTQDARDAGPMLVKALADPNVLVRRNVVLALNGIGYKEALPELLKLLNPDDELMWRGVATAIVLMNPPDDDMVRRLLPGLRSERPLVRLDTIRILGVLGPAALAGLAELEKLSEKDDILECRLLAGAALLRIQAR